MKILIKDCVRIMQAQLILGDPKSLVRRASVDSRKVEPGDLFFALAGEKVDGHQFAISAAKAKVSGVVVSKLDWLNSADHFSSAILKVYEPLVALQKLAEHIRNSFKGAVVGITGSNGKTTTKQMLSSILRLASDGLSTPGNLNSQIGLPLVISELNEKHQWMVLEMGASEPGNIASLCDIAHPSVSILTSIGPAHLKTFGSLQAIAKTKWEIIEALPANGVGIVPWGEPRLQDLIRSSSKKLVFFGDDSSCPVRSSSIEMGEKTRFMLHLGSQSVPVRLPVSGRFNVSNAMAAAAAAWSLNIPIPQIVKGLENFEPAPMRMQVFHHSSGAIVVNDAYNANPVSLLSSVRSIMEAYPDKKRVIVVGSMKELGDESSAFHFNVGTEMGRFAIDQVYVIGPDTDKIIEGATAVGSPAGRFTQIDNQTALINRLEGHLNSETIILVKGSRSMQLEHVVEAIFS